MQEKTGISIRDALPEDRAAMRAITLAAYEEYAKIIPPPFWEGYHKSIIEALDKEGPEQRIVALITGRIVGSVMLYPPAQSAYGTALVDTTDAVPEMRLLAVDPTMRGHGIGAALAHACVRRAQHAGAPALGLHTADFMAIAMPMYERMGFVHVPELDFYPAENIVIKGYRLYF